MNGSTPRDRLQIKAEILEVVSEQPKKLTTIRDDIHTNYYTAQNHVDDLVELELLKEKGGNYYQTSKGEKFLKKYKEAINLMGESLSVS